MDIDLRTLLADDWVEALIGARLTDAGVWDSPDQSDGSAHLRIVESEPDRVRLCGRIWEIEPMVMHSFWIDIERAPSGNGIAWALHYDVLATSARDERNAVDAYDRAEHITWRVALAGHAELRDGVLVAGAVDTVSSS